MRLLLASLIPLAVAASPGDVLAAVDRIMAAGAPGRL